MTNEKYDHQAIEQKWQERWRKDKVFSVSNDSLPTVASRHLPSGRRGAYVLDMFPYPSADGLHVGHPEGYTATDIYSRYLRMNGVQVLHPMGWDAFGLPAENYAIKMGVHPAEVTEKNIANFKRQIQSLGFSYDWDREVNTTDPKYYKWTQWIFLQLFKRGLAYEKEAPIWWCPKDKTGLANEEVVNGKCDRCGTTVEKKMLKQWMLKITAYADRLLEGLNDVDWPEGIKTLQRNWIGKSEGAEVKFDIDETQKVKRVVILHGRDSTSKDHFYPWLKKELETRGFEVQVPDMPSKNGEPDDEEQTDYVQKNCKLDSQTVIVGHSFGGIVGLRLLERGVKINGLVLVSTPFSGTFIDKISRPTVTAAVKKGFKFTTIKKNSGYFEVFGSMNDSAVPLSDSNSFAEHLGVNVTHVTSSKPHFLGVEEPSVIKVLIPSVSVFTTRPDTLFGATYLVLSPEHDLVKTITTDKQKKEVEKYVKSVAAKSDLERTSLEKEKTGVFTGAYAVNPVNNEKIPVWIADYVLSSYGTGAIMAVPAHDERDHVFAKKFKLPIIKVVTPPNVIPPNPMEAAVGAAGMGHLSSDVESECWTDEGSMMNSGVYDGMNSADAREKIVAALQNKGLAQPKTQFKLRDWVFSRQRYWGEPIPLVKCESCKIKVESTKWVLHFYEKPWRAIQSGEKTIETRALNPEEKDRYFGDVKVGDIIKSILKGTNEIMFLRVTKCHKFKNLEELHKQKEILNKLRRNFAPTISELKKFYSLTPDYVDRIQKNGMVAWEIEQVIPGVVPVPEKDLPVLLPDVKKYEPTGTGESPLAGITEWVNTECPNCAERAKKPKYLIFDFDGVIGDTLQQNLQAKVNMGHAADMQEAIKQTNEYFSAKPNHVRGDHFDEAAEKKYHDWSRRFADEMVKLRYKLFTGFIDEIQKIPNAKIAVVSSGYDAYSKKPLEKSGLTYSHLLAGNHHHSKETKIEAVCRDWDVDVKDVYYFTDTQADVYELENLLDRKKIIGCAWGFQGSKKLHEILSDEQILEKFSDIHELWKPSSAKRETNTMPQWAGSCWYYLRFCDPHNDKEFAGAEAMKAWLPVDMYVGGAEHAVLHLLYARFWHKVLFDAGFIPKEVGDEPFKKLKNQGLILGPDGEKMSKSRGNVINPDEIVEKYGADTLRMYEMFMGPFEDAKPWDTRGIVGIQRFLDKVWAQMEKRYLERENDPEDLRLKCEVHLNKLIEKVTDDIEQFRFNTAISALMIFLNEYTSNYSQVDQSKETKDVFLKLLYPFAPHICEELWSKLHHKTTLTQEKWPTFDPKKIIDAKVTIAVQVMGKLRGTLTMPSGSDQASVEVAAKSEKNVMKYLTGEPKKIIFVKDKLVNFVI